MADSKKYTSPVPTDYQEVEYIQSSGNGEYIDTGYVPTVNTKFNIDFQFIEATTPYYESIPVMGERSGATPNSKLALWVNKTSYKEALNFGSYDSGYNTSDITNANVRNVTSNIRANMYYNGVFVRGDNNAEFTTGDLSIYLFALNSSGTLDNRNCVVKLYRYKLYENDVLVRDFVPVYRKSDNVAGLYDTINDVFYTNKGTGNFTVGANISPWQHSLRKLTTATETLSLPQTIYADGTAATVSLKGNTVQNGTPTPSNPVEVNGVGVRTENLVPSPLTPKSETVNGLTFNVRSDGIVEISGTAAESTIYSYKLKTPFTMPTSKTAGGNAYLYYWNTFISGGTIRLKYNNQRVDYWSIIPVNRVISNFDNAENATIDEIEIRIPSGETINGSIGIMVTDNGEIANAYEPYGYKIPISSGGVTTNIYLGSTQTVRQIKKYVMTGNETISIYASDFQRYVITIPTISSMGTRLTPIICTHYIGIYDGRPAEQVPMNAVYTGSATDNSVLIKTDQTTDRSTFIAWLQEQYANGTPVTLWYAVSTPETVAVNEPLMKIGTYADTLSNAAQIPTTEGANSITVDTTVQPSEFTATWTGWHDASVKEKSENLFDVSTANIGVAWNMDLNNNRATVFLSCEPDTDYCFSSQTTGLDLLFICEKANSSSTTAIDNTGRTYSSPMSFTTTSETHCIAIQFNKTNISMQDINNLNTMLNAGSTALPYEPYWK